MRNFFFVLFAISCGAVPLALCAQERYYSSSAERASNYHKAELLSQTANSPKTIYAAIDAYIQVVQIAPGCTDAYLKLGLLYSKLVPYDNKAYGQALFYFDKYAALKPNGAEAVISHKKTLDKRKNTGVISLFCMRIYFYIYEILGI